VDFEPNEQQRAIVLAVETLLTQHAGPARAIELEREGAYDDALAAALRDAGFLGAELSQQTGFLEAALVVEAVAKAGGTVSAAAETLVAAGVVGRSLAGPIAIAAAGGTTPIRFGAHARTLLLDAGDRARIVAVEPGSARPVRSNFMLPLGRPRVPEGDGEELAPGSGPTLRRWWRLALAIECLGTLQGALDITVEYVKRRRQFGRAIGSFQAIQHRLAQCAVQVEATRWLCYEAAARGAPEEASATAAAYATDTAHHVFRETHQLTGAMGYTREHDLHVFSMRLEALRVELGGTSAHRRAIAQARWAAAS
jgi:alkylation response protein AidB-like acyl-CoA dehydrogenase